MTLRTYGWWLKSWRQIVKKNMDSRRMGRCDAEMVRMAGMREEEG